jgi:flavodoxin
MTSRILVAYATKHGSTWEVAEAIATSLRKQGLEADVQRGARRGEPRALPANLERCDAVILGGALYMGRWHRDARHFLERHRRLLGAIPVAVFAMGPATTEETSSARWCAARSSSGGRAGSCASRTRAPGPRLRGLAWRRGSGRLTTRREPPPSSLPRPSPRPRRPPPCAVAP